MSTRSGQRRGLMVAIAGVLALPFSTLAQSVYTGVNNGDWATPGNWTLGVPTSGVDARINNNAGAVNVNLAASTTGSVANLTIDAGDSLTLLNNSTLNIGGNLIANGTLRFMTNPNEAFLNFSNPAATISGLIDFNFQTGSPTAGVIQGPGSGTLTNNGTIQGLGTLRNIRFTNAAGGVLDGNDSRGQLYLDANNGAAGLFINNGIIRATGGGLVTFAGDSGGDFISTGGTIQANGAGSVVRFLNSASVTGGTYSTTGGGQIVVEAGHTGFASGFTLTAGSTFRLRNNSVLNVSGTITNNGTINFTQPNTNESFIDLNANTTLAGSGTVQMDFNNVAGTPAGVIRSNSGSTLTINSTQTIAGVGSLRNLKVNNAGLLDANNGVAGANASGSLYLDPSNAGAGLFVNTGTMRSSSGGLMQLTGDFGGDFNNVGGTISSIGTGSITELVNSASVTGGTFSNSGGGTIRVRPGMTGFLNGPITIGSGSTFLVPATATSGQTQLNLNGTLAGGTLRLDAAGAVSLLTLNGSATLANGTVLRGTYTNVSGTSPGPRIDTNSNTLTINAGATADGVVYFNNARVTNNGTITSNTAAGMYVDANNGGPGLFVNNSIMEAAAGGLMQLVGDNGGDFLNNGTIRAVGAGSIVELTNSVTVTGGTITTSGGGIVRVPAGRVASLVGPATVSAGSQLTVQGATAGGQAQLNVSGNYTLNGTLDLNAAGATAVLNIAGSTTLGSGTLRGLYTNISNSPGPRIDTNSNTLTVSNASTVQGVVFFNNARVINNGTIDANNPAGMYVDPNNQAAGLFVNNATMRSSGGGLMQLSGDNGGDFVSGPSGVYSSTGAGSILELVNSVTVTGGTWTNTAGGVIRVRPGLTASLVNPTISAGSTFVVETTAASGQTQLNLNGSLSGGGTLELRSNNPGGSTPILNIASPVTLNSGSTVWGSFNTTGNGARIDAAGNTLTIAGGATVRGVVFFNNSRVVNNGAILADNHVVPDAIGNADMYIDANNSAGQPLFVNNGTISATNNARIYFTGDFGGTFGGTGPLNVAAGAQIVSWNSAGGDMGPVAGAGTFIAANSANLGFQSYRVGSLQATNSGVARVTAGATPALAAGTSKVGTVVLSNNGRIDLTNNGLVVTGMTPAAVRSLIATGRAAGAWNGNNGIGSSLANSNGRAIGYMQASEFFTTPGLFLGQTFALTDVLARFTFNGDSDLNGSVDFDDLLRVAQNYDTVGTGTWFKGDFTYDGNINFDDLLALAQQYNKSLLASGGDWSALNDLGGSSFVGDWTLALSMVPEPTSLSIPAGGLIVLRRRR